MNRYQITYALFEMYLITTVIAAGSLAEATRRAIDASCNHDGETVTVEQI